jgi:hypothetical protein
MPLTLTSRRRTHTHKHTHTHTHTGKFPQERLKFVLEHSGIDREATGCDIDLPSGKLFFSITTLGKALSQKGGGISIDQFRWLIRKERRIVGVFKADAIPTRAETQ